MIRVARRLRFVGRSKQLRLLFAVTAAWLAWAGWMFASGRGEMPLLVLDETGSPVASASVLHGSKVLSTSDDSGRTTIDWTRSLNQLTLEAAGYEPRVVDVQTKPDGELRVRVEARYLRGQVVDPDGRPISGVYVSSGAGEAVTDRSGQFLVRKAESGTVDVWRPAWTRGDFDWDGSPGKLTISIAPRVAKAVHVTGEIAGSRQLWAETIDRINSTELNAVMLDLKPEDGLVLYDSQVPFARSIGAVDPMYDLSALAMQLHERDIYLIGRIVAFQDPTAARRAPEMAVRSSATGKPYSKAGQYFLDPTDVDARQYALDLAGEACGLGVDEIQFDYVRYPDGFSGVAVFDGGSDEAARVDAIQSFLREARAVLHPLGCAVAGDIFGFITTALDDGGIGQQWEVVSSELDVVSPMLYPSHYDAGWYGFDKPNDHPGPMVDRALKDAMRRLETGAVVRPWLQDFGYTADQVRDQIDSAESHGLGWMLWNFRGVVSDGALRPSP